MISANPTLAELTLVHSSDIHIDAGYTARKNDGDGTAGLGQVLKASLDVKADITLLAGDLFEHNRLATSLLDQVKKMLGDAERKIVILPGNHDPLTKDSVYRRGSFDALGNVSVLGLTHEPSVVFEELDIEIWGNAHFNYSDMAPLRNPIKRSCRWHIAMAHGHYDNDPHENPLRRASWLFGNEDINALQADYVALGHWDIAKPVGPSHLNAHYSGSPDHAGSVNVVRLDQKGNVDVLKHILT
jgi:DNA repair exonuclease SbcCD nuclease subunit